MLNIKHLIEPSSIAIIGASSDKNKVGYQITNNILEGGYRGKTYPVNPKHESVLGLKCYKSINEISQIVDLTIVAIPAKFVLDTIKECANKTRAIIVISSGFAESSPEGKENQEKIASICNKENILFLGPNCLGLLNLFQHLNASFAADTPQPGNVSLLSQSGAMISSLIDWSNDNSVGFSKIFSLGNKAQIDETFLLQYLYDDKSTEVIVLYLEQLKSSDDLTHILTKNSKKKPTIVLFGGKSEAGGKAAASHTGSVVGSYVATETYLKQLGVVIAHNLEELFSLILLFSRFQKISGNNIAVITNAGGPGVAACDAITDSKLTLSNISEKTSTLLRNNLPPGINIGNPIDLLGDATSNDYHHSVSIINDDKNIDAIIILLTRQSSTNIEEITDAISSIKATKPIYFVHIGGDNYKAIKKKIELGKKNYCLYPEQAVRSLSCLYEFTSHATESISKSSTRQLIYIPSKQEEILASFNLPLLKYHHVTSEYELKLLADKLEFPLVAKTAKENIHKSEHGGVILNINTLEELILAFNKLGKKAIIGKMIAGHEIFLGAKVDPNIGPVIAFGTGGIYSEIFKDFSYRVAPISKKTALNMIKETKIGEILSGARGQTPLDTNKLAEIIVNVGKFIDSFSNIRELDFNPIVGNKKGFYIVDARIITENEAK